MVDLNSLLKWTLANSDGKKYKYIKPMQVERKKWLEEALTHNCMDEVRKSSF